MPYHLLRTVHQAISHHSQNQSQNVELPQRLLYFIISYVILLLSTYFFLPSSIDANTQRYSIHPLPPQLLLYWIYGLVIAMMGVLGILCSFYDLWTGKAWLFYFLMNLLTSLSIFLYQTGKGFTIFAIGLVGVANVVVAQRLFMEAGQMEAGWENGVIRNFVGALLGWTFIWALVSLGQWVVHDLRMDRNCQAIFFFILAVLGIVGLAFWNHEEGYAKWRIMYGLSFSAATLIFLTAIATWQRH